MPLLSNITDKELNFLHIKKATIEKCQFVFLLLFVYARSFNQCSVLFISQARQDAQSYFENVISQ